MKRLGAIYSFFFIGSVSFVVAQSHLDLISLGYRFELQQELIDSDSEVAVGDAIFNIAIPIPIDDQDAIIFSAQNHLLSFNSDNDASLDFDNWGIRLGLAYRKQWNESWYSLAQVQGTIAGDLAAGASQSFSGGGLLILGYQAKENLQYRFGLYGAREFFGPFFVPILGVDWKVRPKLRIYGNLPITANINYTLSPRIWTGFGFIGNVASFSVREGINDTYLEQLSNQAYLYVNFYLTTNLVFETRVGHIIGRDFFLFDRADRVGTRVSALEFNDDRVPLSPAFKDSPFIEFRLNFRLDLENRE